MGSHFAFLIIENNSYILLVKAHKVYFLVLFLGQNNRKVNMIKGAGQGAL